jgi:hypothetical protein
MISNDLQELPLLPHEQVQAAYGEAHQALAALSSFGLEHYRPPASHVSDEMTRDERYFDGIAEQLAWGLRVADSFGNQEMITAIGDAVAGYPDFEYYLAYNLLSSAYEREAVLKLEGYRLNSISRELKGHLLQVLIEQVAHTQSPVELEWLACLMARVIYWLPWSTSPETYIGIDDVGPVVAALAWRQTIAPLTEAKSLQGIAQIQRYWGRIQAFRQKGDKRAVLQ